MGNILVIGSLNMDLVTQTERLPLPGETIHGKQFRMVPGGKGANQAAAAARLGGSVLMAGRVGEDSFGVDLKASLNAAGADTAHVITTPGLSTGIASILVDDQGENNIVVVGGANFAVTESDIDALAEVMRGCSHLILQFETPLPAVGRAIKLAKMNGMEVILNPAPAYAEGRDLLPLVDHLVLNETEISLFTGLPVTTTAEAESAARAMLQAGTKTVLLTLGGDGVFVMSADEQFHLPAKQVQVVDTTAAGDAFTGALAVALWEGKGLREAAAFANCAGALTVTRLGAQTSLPTRVELEAFIAAHPDG